ncbi:MAG: hypothetical protein Q7U54_15180 [Bacteroidales bacterium]|nr:hypothetical protein [Bacteroidales bacterium]
MDLVSNKFISTNRSHLQVKVTNIGKVPAFMTKIDVVGIKRAFYAADNYYWLAPGESREIMIEILWREPVLNKNIVLIADAWNAKKQTIKLN